MGDLYAGVMSGTSLDGIDSVLASFDAPGSIKIQKSTFEPYPHEFRSTLKLLLNDPQPDSKLASEVDSTLGGLFADAILRLLEDQPKDDVQAVGCHGQTIIHRPNANPPYTWQAGDGNIIAQKTGLPVVTDFRSADMRAGGQGAPLTPAFHQFAFQSTEEARAVVNIGGIANVSYLPADLTEKVIGFDTGPGNALSDQWINLHKGFPYDKDGQWALSSDIDENLLNQLMTDQYFQQPNPKSLDSRYFSIDWLQSNIRGVWPEPNIPVIQSTIAALTAESIWQGIRLLMPPVQKIYLCGGGAHNQAIVKRLEDTSELQVANSEELGMAPDLVEACAIAWFAERRMVNSCANLPSVTGASREVMLGSIIQPD